MSSFSLRFNYRARLLRFGEFPGNEKTPGYFIAFLIVNSKEATVKKRVVGTRNKFIV